MRIPKKQRRRPGSTLVVAIAAGLVLIPLLWMLSIAFTPGDEVSGKTPQLIPSSPTFENFGTAIDAVNLDRAMLNSAVIGLAIVVSNVVIACLAGYAFAKLQFRGSKVLFAMLISTAMIPGAVQLIPLFLITKGIPFAGGNNAAGVGGTGLLDTLAGVALPHLVGPLMIFLARQYFYGLPDEIGESARIDGASEWRIFWQVYLPLARPIVATVAIFSFVGSWDDFLWPLVVTASEETRTVQLALASFLSSGNLNYGAAMAGTLIVTLPVIAVFMFNQRSFTAGLSDGSVKG